MVRFPWSGTLLATALTVAAVIASVSGSGAQEGPATAAPDAAPAETQSAVFAGGCFWCVEADYDKVEGVLETISGFAGGDVANPSYEQVTAGGTGHLEVVKVTFDPSVVTYRSLVDYFWRHVDPLDDGGQFCDRGDSYRTGVFVSDASQRTDAEASKAAAESVLGKTIVTEIIDFDAFYPAEAYHQDYYLENPLRYRGYRFACGRDRRIRAVWGDAE